MLKSIVIAFIITVFGIIFTIGFGFSFSTFILLFIFVASCFIIWIQLYALDFVEPTKSKRYLKRKYYKCGLSTDNYIREAANIDGFKYMGRNNKPKKVLYAGHDITEKYKACNNVLEQLELIDSLTVKL